MSIFIDETGFNLTFFFPFFSFLFFHSFILFFFLLKTLVLLNGCPVLFFFRVCKEIFLNTKDKICGKAFRSTKHHLSVMVIPHSLTHWTISTHIMKRRTTYQRGKPSEDLLIKRSVCLQWISGKLCPEPTHGTLLILHCYDICHLSSDIVVTLLLEVIVYRAVQSWLYSSGRWEGFDWSRQQSHKWFREVAVDSGVVVTSSCSFCQIVTDPELSHTPLFFCQLFFLLALYCAINCPLCSIGCIFCTCLTPLCMCTSCNLVKLLLYWSILHQDPGETNKKSFSVYELYKEPTYLDLLPWHAVRMVHSDLKSLTSPGKWGSPVRSLSPGSEISARYSQATQRTFLGLSGKSS